ncbi:non-ribosomal peptide synthetase [Amycolatopsis dendrobii]|uniref:Amino acid adenylation domain-containing protein n=1 Tax=Amycolatopsis dendrobii TaxID=2760662 RepID=A0A7W3Z9E1_9PSEU|nr:non-ribosomal peptide synthetase [Amycolatopsis dendrobii]MBB1152518.1 amino acid adenylation domain-containing protein [Amycolatopsis dendrobii]
MAVSEVFTRPISPLEWMRLASPPDSMAIQIVVEGAGSLDVERLRHAVAVAGDACPGARLVRRGRRWVDSGIAPEVRVVAGHAADVPDLINSPALARPLRGDRGRPMTEVVLFPGPTPTMVFRTHHALMDGRGALTWVAEVFAALRGEQGRPAVDAVTEADLLAQAGVEPQPPARRFVDVVLESRAAASRRTGVRLRRSVTGNHPALVAKITEALVRQHDADELICLIPVDLRRHRPQARLTANLSGGLTLPISASMTWQQIHQRLLLALSRNEELASLPTSKAAASILRLPLGLHRATGQLADATLSRRGQAPWHFAITHLGQVELAEFSTADFQARTVYSAPWRGLLVPPTISIIECDRHTEIVLSMDDDPALTARGEQLLDGIVDRLAPPESRLSGGTPDPRYEQGTLVSLFRAAVAAHPDSIALSTDDSEVTFAELDLRVTAVAAELRRRGVRTGDVVGVLAGRSIAAIAAIFGILRAGAAFLPLDTEHPDARLASVLTAAAARVCVVERAHAGRPAVPAGCAALVLEDLPTTTEETVEIAVAPEDLAAVFYTSGSTGRPKGVELEHRNLAGYAGWAIEALGIDADCCFAMFSSLAYVGPYTAVFLPLFAGGRIELATGEPNHVTLRRLLRERGVNCLKVTPSHLELINRLDVRAEGIRLVVFGGERLRSSVAARAQEIFGPECRIFNADGLTEMSGGCTLHRYDPDLDDPARSVPIGRPVRGTVITLHDPNGVAVPEGEVGEMYFAGIQLCRGYHDRPELNKERFVQLADGTRAYRSGDLARMLPGGELEHMGRIDDQIKILGHRIEPTEVAGALEKHDAVVQALVVPHTRDTGHEQTTLCGYVVLSRPVPSAELIAHAASLLPRHLVPSVVLTMAEFPRIANGKIDVKALPDPYPARADAERQTEPLDDIATQVARIWADTLGIGIAEVIRQGDFNLLGGDSISLLAMLASVSRELVRDAGTDFVGASEKVIGNPTLDQVVEMVHELNGPTRSAEHRAG